MSMGQDLQAAAEERRDGERRTMNPKTLMGRTKIPMFSVVPPVALIHLAHAMRYGAFEAKKKDGTRGYGPFNWREIAIEYSTYLDAACRHIAAFADGEDCSDEDSRVHHLGHAMATLGILLDAIECGTAIDDRPKVGRGTAAKVMQRLKVIHAIGVDDGQTGPMAPMPAAADLMALAATIPAPAPGTVEQAIADGAMGRCHPADCDPDCPGPGKQRPDATLVDALMGRDGTACTPEKTLEDAHSDVEPMCPVTCPGWPGFCDKRRWRSDCKGGA